MLRYINFRDNHLFGLHDFYAAFNNLAEELPTVKTDKYEYREIRLAALKYKDCDKRIHKHKEERIKNPPQPTQERARYFGLKFRL